MNKKDYSAGIIIVFGTLFQLCIFLLAAACLFGVFPSINLTPIDLSEEKQAQLDRDTAHAVDDAKEYLEEKYHTEYKLNTFEPYIYFVSSEAIWVRTHYNSTWTGEFTIDGKRYEIKARVSENIFGDTYQAEQIRSAYKELAMQYFPDTYEKDGVVYEVEYKIGFRRDPNTGYGAGFFAAYYDGNNLEDMLQENGMSIAIEIDDDVEVSDEFWLKCEEAVVNLERKFKGVEFKIEELDSGGYDYSDYGNWKLKTIWDTQD